MTTSAETLRSLLMEFAEETNPDSIHFTGRFRSALLAFGSSTEDNKTAAERIDFGELQDSGTSILCGLRIAKLGHSISGVLNLLEGEEIPAAVRLAIPELTQEDFDSALRVAVLCLSAFDNAIETK